MIQVTEAEAVGRSFRIWLGDNATGGATKVHQLIREPIGFQAAPFNAVDEHLKPRSTCAGIWQAETPGLVRVWLGTAGRCSPRS